MGGIYVSQEKTYPSIYIAPTVDFTERLLPAEKGVIAAIGKLSFGNPYRAVILGNNTEQLKTTIPAFGGTQDNEFAYHIADYFAGYKGKMIIGRVLQTNAKTKVLALAKDANTGDITLTETDINIFGANNIEDWKDTPNTDDLAIVINACIAEKHSLKVTYEKDIDELAVSLYDRAGNKIYEVAGGSTVDSVDEFGKHNFVGMLADRNIVTIKTDKSSNLWEADFVFVKEFTNGLVEEPTDDTTKNYDIAVNAIGAVIEDADYFITAGLTDIPTIQKIRGLCYEAKVPMIIDLYGNTIDAVVALKNSYGFSDELTYWIWNRGKDKFESGEQTIGLSGWFAGQTVRKNLSKMVDDVESRVEGIAGVDYTIPRQKADVLQPLGDEELKKLTKARINTLRVYDKKVCISDVLSGYPRNSALRMFPIAEAKVFLDRYIGRIIQQKLFKNANEALLFVREEVRLLFEKADKANYFDKQVDVRWKYQVSVTENDKINVVYSCVMGGVIRRGRIEGSIVKKINV